MFYILKDFSIKYEGVSGVLHGVTGVSVMYNNLTTEPKYHSNRTHTTNQWNQEPKLKVMLVF